MTTISDLGNRSSLAWVITDRANGIFLWAVFAVTQMKKACRDGYGENSSEPSKRLDDMGKDLNGAISQMLQKIEKPHRPALAFYLQALKSWNDGDMERPLTVGLISLSRSGEDMQTGSEFLAACRKEQRDIQNFSQGILEVSCSSVSDITEPLPSKEMFTLVRSHRDRSSEGDLEPQRGPSNFEPGEGAWVTMAYSDDHREIEKFLRTYISFIHRSAYDFFFAPDDWNEGHANRCTSLLGHNGESEVYAKVRAGLKKLLWITPSPKFLRKASKKYTLLAKIEECSDKIITYIVHNCQFFIDSET